MFCVCECMCQTITVYSHSCHHRYNHRYHHRWARWVVTLAAGRHCPVSSSFFATPQPGPILFDAIMISKIILTGLFLFVYAPATTTIPVRSLSNVRARQVGSFAPVPRSVQSFYQYRVSLFISVYVPFALRPKRTIGKLENKRARSEVPTVSCTVTVAGPRRRRRSVCRSASCESFRKGGEQVSRR